MNKAMAFSKNLGYILIGSLIVLSLQYGFGEITLVDTGVYMIIMGVSAIVVYILWYLAHHLHWK